MLQQVGKKMEGICDSLLSYWLMGEGDYHLLEIVDQIQWKSRGGLITPIRFL